MLNENQLEDIRSQVKSAFPEMKPDDINFAIEYLMFLWVFGNLEHIASVINVREIRGLLSTIIARRDTPAYDLIGYLCRLDSAEELTESVRTELRRALTKHDHAFAKRVLSLATQAYINTHRSRPQIERSVCDLLGIQRMIRITPTA